MNGMVCKTVGVFVILGLLGMSCGILNLRKMTWNCKEAEEKFTFCATFPKDCDKQEGYPCQLIVTVKRFDIPCIKRNLEDPYIQVLCNKRYKTFKVSILRLVDPHPQNRSCPEANVRAGLGNNTVEELKKCFKTEFVGISFTPGIIRRSAEDITTENTIRKRDAIDDEEDSPEPINPNEMKLKLDEIPDNLLYVTGKGEQEADVVTPGPTGYKVVDSQDEVSGQKRSVGSGGQESPSVMAVAEEGEIFYVCVADDVAVTTWRSSNGTAQKIKKFMKGDVLIPYQNLVLHESGIGVYWENVNPLHPDWTDFGCEFVISIDEDTDMFWDNNGTMETVEMPDHRELNIKMIQGLVKRHSIDNHVVEVPLEAPSPPDTSNFLLEDMHPRNDTPLVLNTLEMPQLYSFSKRQSREVIEADHKLHDEFWHPMLEACRLQSAVCFVMDDDHDCYRAEKEECMIVLSLQFENNAQTIRVKLAVEEWPWGGFAFSKDRMMGDDIGFFCMFRDPTVAAGARLNLDHSSKDGDDPRLKNLINVVRNVSKRSEHQRYCEWTMPTKYQTSTRPHGNSTISVDLLNGSYVVQLAVGGNADGVVAYHTRKLAAPIEFSRDMYIAVTKGALLLPSFVCLALLLSFIVILHV